MKLLMHALAMKKNSAVNYQKAIALYEHNSKQWNKTMKIGTNMT
jgi:hypothetical protein